MNVCEERYYIIAKISNVEIIVCSSSEKKLRNKKHKLGFLTHFKSKKYVRRLRN